MKDIKSAENYTEFTELFEQLDTENQEHLLNLMKQIIEMQEKDK